MHPRQACCKQLLPCVTPSFPFCLPLQCAHCPNRLPSPACSSAEQLRHRMALHEEVGERLLALKPHLSYGECCSPTRVWTLWWGTAVSIIIAVVGQTLLVPVAMQERHQHVTSTVSWQRRKWSGMCCLMEFRLSKNVPAGQQRLCYGS